MWEAEVGMGWIEFAGYCPLAGEQMAGDWDVAVVIVVVVAAVDIFKGQIWMG